MKIFIEKTGETKDIEFSGTVKQLLETLKLAPGDVLVVRENTLLTDDIELVDKDSLKLLSVTSGG
ncbi:MAG: hypothetical protein V1725_03135 [archaeon]